MCEKTNHIHNRITPKRIHHFAQDSLLIPLAISLIPFTVMADSSIGYFEDIDSQRPIFYYWFTPFQYIKWRHSCHGKSMKDATDEFVWLRDVHQLIKYYTEGDECYFFISVDTVEFFQYMADKYSWSLVCQLNWKQTLRVAHMWSAIIFWWLPFIGINKSLWRCQSVWRAIGWLYIISSLCVQAYIYIYIVLHIMNMGWCQAAGMSCCLLWFSICGWARWLAHHIMLT